MPLCGPEVVDVVVDEAFGDRQFGKLLRTTRGLGCGLNAAEGSVDDALVWESSLVDDPGKNECQTWVWIDNAVYQNDLKHNILKSTLLQMINGDSVLA